MLQKGKYNLLSDRELVDGLTAVPINNRLHEYFFKEKCRHFLSYISTTLYNEENFDVLIGELYEFLSNNNWKILKMWEGKNGCSLNSYLASCSMRYFTGKLKAEKQRRDLEVTPSFDEIGAIVNSFIADDDTEYLPVWEAYRMLNDRDRLVLRLLVIDDADTMQAARLIWPYINSSRDINELSPKHVRSLIAMSKHRALLTLLNNMNKLQAN